MKRTLVCFLLSSLLMGGLMYSAPLRVQATDITISAPTGLKLVSQDLVNGSNGQKYIHVRLNFSHDANNTSGYYAYFPDGTSWIQTGGVPKLETDGTRTIEFNTTCHPNSVSGVYVQAFKEVSGAPADRVYSSASNKIQMTWPSACSNVDVSLVPAQSDMTVTIPTNYFSPTQIRNVISFKTTDYGAWEFVKDHTLTPAYLQNGAIVAEYATQADQGRVLVIKVNSMAKPGTYDFTVGGTYFGKKKSVVVRLHVNGTQAIQQVSIPQTTSVASPSPTLISSTAGSTASISPSSTSSITNTSISSWIQQIQQMIAQIQSRIRALQQTGIHNNTDTTQISNQNTQNQNTSNQASSNSNKSPVITGISGPTSLKVGQTGTWAVKAYDPEEGNLSYAITWGDEGTLKSTKNITSSLTEQKMTVSHVYNKAGTYAPVFIVSDAQGASAQSSVSVKVNQDISSVTRMYLSRNAHSPIASTLQVSNDGAVHEAGILDFDLRASGDTIRVDELKVFFDGNADETVAYLYDGSTLFASSQVVGNVAYFGDLSDYLSIANGSTKTVTLKVDYEGITSQEANSKASIYTSVDKGFVAYNSRNTAVSSLNGSAISDVFKVVSNSIVEQVKELLAKISEFQNKNALLVKQSSDLRSQISSLFARVQELEKNIASCGSSVKNSTAPIYPTKTASVSGSVSSNTQIQELLDFLAKLQTQNSLLSKEVSSLQNMVQVLLAQIVALQSQAEKACVVVYGDVNNSGNVNATDALLVSQYIAGRTTFDASQKQKADVNKDGSITNVDVCLITAYYVGNISSLPFTGTYKGCGQVTTPLMQTSSSQENATTATVLQAAQQALRELFDLLNK